MAAKRGGRKSRGHAAKEPQPEDYKSEVAYKDAMRDYRRFRAAQRVWKQIEPEERLWLLQEFRYKDPIAALERDTARGSDLQELKLTKKKLKDIGKYPRSKHRRDIYRARLAGSPPRKDIRVRKHEKRLQEAGLRRPYGGA